MKNMSTRRKLKHYHRLDGPFALVHTIVDRAEMRGLEENNREGERKREERAERKLKHLGARRRTLRFRQ